MTASDRADTVGWFDWHASKHGYSGAGGRSSFILTKNAELPKGKIPTHNDRYAQVYSKEYSLKKITHHKWWN